ncbi:nicotinamidase-related amidase [Rhodococcus sp. 27YEA15]|uniref:isochorismatase family protein n=1 Tax=Rhodococcus sp. 27YEA15 TaxID=3156259 RepID=UPI003C7A1A90
MPITTISDNAALVVIDLQTATAALPTQPLDPASVVSAAASLAKDFRSKGRSVIWVNVAGAPAGRTEAPGGGGGQFPEEWTQLVSELGVQEGDETFTKHAWGAFHDGRFHALLEKLNCDQIVLAGIATSAGVESTARSAFDRGFNVAVVTDAIADVNAAAHRHSVDQVFPLIGETASTEEIRVLLGI